MAELSFSRQVALAMPSGETVVGFAASSDKLYFLTNNASNESNVRVFSKGNSLTAPASVAADDFTIANSANWNDCALHGELLACVLRSPDRVYFYNINTPTQGSLVNYSVSSTELRTFTSFGDSYALTGIRYSAGRFHTSLTYTSGSVSLSTGSLLNSNNDRPSAAANSASNIYIWDSTDRVFYVYDLSFADAGFQQRLDATAWDPRPNPAPSTNLINCAFSDGQLLVYDGQNEKLYFYGEEPPMPVMPGDDGNVRQLTDPATYRQFSERFDAASDSPFTLKSTDFEAIRETTTRFVNVPGSDTLESRLKTYEIIPIYVQPDIEEGDYIFPRGDADATAVPTTGRYRVVGIQRVGNNKRQTFICQES